MRRIDDADKEAKDQNKSHKTIFVREKLDKNGKILLESADDCRWSNFSVLDNADEILEVVSKKAFPFIKGLNDPNQPYTRHMQNAVFGINNATLLKEAIDDINSIFEDIKKQQEEGQQFQDTQGDVYEYLINEIGISGKNGQFRTPRHIIQFMCELIDPDVNDKIYESRGGFSVFYNDLKSRGIPNEIQADFIELARKLRDTTTRFVKTDNLFKLAGKRGLFHKVCKLNK